MKKLPYRINTQPTVSISTAPVWLRRPKLMP
jgi:hypothetical protein